jgi:hypothetical protein
MAEILERSGPVGQVASISFPTPSANAGKSRDVTGRPLAPRYELAYHGPGSLAHRCESERCSSIGPTDRQACWCEASVGVGRDGRSV